MAQGGKNKNDTNMIKMEGGLRNLHCTVHGTSMCTFGAMWPAHFQ